MGEQSPPHARYHPVLDGIRGMAILLVMLHHFCMGSEPADLWLDRIVFGITESGWCGVDLFFVLSGFLITGILWDSKPKQGYFRNFYARRTLRIFPLYYAVLLVFYVVFPLVPVDTIRDYVAQSQGDQLWFWTYLTNFKILSRESFYDHLIPNVFWSLAIEEQFYLVWPLVVWLCGRRSLMTLCGVIVLGSLGVRIALAATGESAVTSFVLTFARTDTLAVGAFLAMLARRERGLAPASGVARIVVLVTLAFLLIVAADTGGLRWTDWITNTLGFSALALCFGATLTLAYVAPSGSWVRGFFDNAPLRLLGKYSYAMYLFHGPAGTFTRRLLFDPENGSQIGGSSVPRVLAFSALASLVTLIGALLSWNLMEKHFLRLKDRFQSA